MNTLIAILAGLSPLAFAVGYLLGYQRGAHQTALYYLRMIYPQK